jgi:hypothetical protein
MRPTPTVVTALVAASLLALSPSAAAAEGVAISWKNFCWGEEGSANNLTWLCNSNTNTNVRMTCSFKLDAATPDFNGVGVFLEGMTEASAVPDWWKLGAAETGDCRAGAISVSADGSVLANGGTDVCIDPWTPNGGGNGGLGLYSWDTNRMHANAAWALADAIPLEANVEYFALQFRVSAEKTVGGCAGCLIPVIWGLSRIDWTTPTTINSLDICYTGGNQCVTWQNSTLPCGVCNPDDARNTTWGQIKSLYR